MADMKMTQADCAHSKHQLYKGQLMVMTGKDGNEKMVNIAIKLCPQVLPTCMPICIPCLKGKVVIYLSGCKVVVFAFEYV